MRVRLRLKVRARLRGQGLERLYDANDGADHTRSVDDVELEGMEGSGLVHWRGQGQG